MLEEYQRSNGQIVSIATRHVSAVLNEDTTVIARSLRSNEQETRGYLDCQQSDEIRFLFCTFKLILMSFDISGCSNYLWKRRQMFSSA